MTADLNQQILNSQPSRSPSPLNEPYRLTFYVENETHHASQWQLTDLTESQSHRQSYNNNYDEVVIESFESPVDNVKYSRYARGASHESYCVLSAFLYFVTITTFVYLAILWIRQKMHVRMEQMHWW